MKRHSPTEIRAKLRQADELEHQGVSQPEICKAIGISVMTLHRWRKDPQIRNAEQRPAADIDASPAAQDVDALVLENRRLRKIVADLLLEKARLEENLTLRSPKPGRPKS
jgi:transposase-like protein